MTPKSKNPASTPRIVVCVESFSVNVSVHGAANRMVDFEGVRHIFRSYRTLQISLSSRKMRQTPGA